MTFDLNLNEDQRQICDAATAMLEANYPVGRLRSGAPDDLAQLTEFGLYTLARPEEHGGTGFTPTEEALVHVLLGKHVVSTRALAGSVAARLTTDTLPVCAAVESGDSLMLIEPSENGLSLIFGTGKLQLVRAASITPAKSLGDGVPVGRARLVDVTVVAETTQQKTILLADLLVAAQLLGVAQGALDLAVSYAKIRTQFGKPIGAFQAIKHHCATMAVETEMLSSLLDMAAIAVTESQTDVAFQVAALRLLAPKVALANARTCIQIHGGIGFSDEADAHQFLKQAHILSRLGNGSAVLDHPAPLAPHHELQGGQFT